MPAIVIPIVGLAAVLHAAWNIILKTSGDPLLTAFRLTFVGVVVAAPILAVWYAATGWPAIPPAGLGLAVVSGFIEAGYFVALSAAYRRGDLSVVYPIARGSAPLLAVAIGTIVLGETLAPVGWLGVACLLIGVLVISRPWQAIRGRRVDAAVGFALLTGATIAAYSAVDRVGVQIMAPVAYGIILFAVATAILAAWIWFSRRRTAGDATAGDVTAGDATAGDVTAGDATAAAEAPWARSAAAGLMAMLAYLLVLIAFSIAPLVVVAPLRESAIVLVSGWGAIRLGEASDRTDVIRRIGGAVLVLVGIVLLVAAA